MSNESDAAASSSGQSAAGQDVLAVALARLNNALDGLSSAVDATLEKSAEKQNVGEEVQRMADDRAKLGKDLDAAEARAQRLAQANSEVSRRLVGAMEMVRGVLDKKA